MRGRILALVMVNAFLVACSDDSGPGPSPDGMSADMAQQDMGTADSGGSDLGNGSDVGGADGAMAAVEEVNCSQVTPDAEVKMQNTSFSPAAITISAGQIIRWTNNDAIAHTVTSGNPSDSDAGSLFDSGNLSQGQSYCLKFNSAGSYDYYCIPHPVAMGDGVVTVQ